MKFIHTADIHLDAPLRSMAVSDPAIADLLGAATRSTFQTIIELALSHEVDGLIIAGDLYDGAVADLSTASFVARQFRRLDDAGIPVFAIKGNHDFANGAADLVALPKNVKVFSPEGGTAVIEAQPGKSAVAIHGRSFGTRHVPDSLLPGYPAPKPNHINVGLLHSSLAGAGAHDTYSPCSVEDLAAVGYDYWALGHIHIRSVHREHPFVVMPGCPQGRHINEIGEKSVTLIHISDGRISALEEIPTAKVRFEQHQLRVSVETDLATLQEDLRNLVSRRALALEAPSTAAVLRITIAGAPGLLRKFRRLSDALKADAAAAGEEAGQIWIEDLRFKEEAGAEELAGDSALLEMIETMRAHAASPAGQLQVDAAVEEALSILGPARAQAYPTEEDETDLRARLTRHAIEEMSALLGAGDERSET